MSKFEKKNIIIIFIYFLDFMVLLSTTYEETCIKFLKLRYN